MAHAGTRTPGVVWAGKGCVIPWLGGTQSKETDFEVLTGTGYEWANQKTGDPPPPYSMHAGHDKSTLFIGRCNAGGSVKIGKINFDNKLYYSDDSVKEKSDCDDPHEILLCH